MPRLFVAALPSRATVDVLRSAPRPDEPGVRWVPESNWHVTLRFLGEADTDEVTRSLRGTDAASCRAVLGPSVERLGERQIVVPVAGVDELAAAVRQATESIGQPDRRPFVGHLTIARTKPRAASALPGAPIASTFDVDEIVVMASDLRPTGAVYSVVATVKLGPGPRHD